MKLKKQGVCYTCDLAFLDAKSLNLHKKKCPRHDIREVIGLAEVKE